MFKAMNWKLALLALIFIFIFLSLGFWQLHRAHEKKILLQSFQDRIKQKPLDSLNLNSVNDLRFYRTQLVGHFDNKHILLLDNRTQNKKIGYEVYIPFKAKGLKKAILIDMGFIEMGINRKKLPQLIHIDNEVTITGLLNLPPAYFAYGSITDNSDSASPQVVEYINIKEITALLGYPLFPYLILIDPNDSHAYPIEWRILIMPPEKHVGYALQWFAFALTLLILFVVLSRGRSSS